MDRLLSPFTEEQFFAEYFGRAVLHVPGEAAKFSGLQSFELLSLEVERGLQAPVRCHIHKGSGAIPATWLEHDLVVCQAAGATEWQIADGDSHRELPLKQGAMFYAPTGRVESGKAFSDDALTVVMSIEHPTGSQLLDFVCGALRNEPWFQTPLPRFADPAAQADYLQEFRAQLKKVIEAPGLLRWFAQYQIAHAPAGPQIGTVWRPDLPDSYLIVLRARRNVRIRRATEDTVYFLLAGQRYDFPEYAVPALQFLLDRTPVSIGEFRAAFANEFDADEISDLLSVLCANGFVAVMERAA